MEATGKGRSALPSTEVGPVAADCPTTIKEIRETSLTRLQTAASGDEVEIGDAARGSRNIDNPNRQDWEHYRSVITHLYMIKDQPLRLVRGFMFRHHRFKASDRMFKQRIKEWGLVKNAKRKALGMIEDNRPDELTDGPPHRHGQPVNMREIPGLVDVSSPPRQCRRRSTSSGSLESENMWEEDDISFNSTPASSQTNTIIQSTPPALALSRNLAAPGYLRTLEDILINIDRYYLGCFRGPGPAFTNHVLGSSGVSFVDTDDRFTDMGLLEIHDPGYAAISLAKSRQYREARILLGETQDKVKNLLQAQHPTLLPFILEIICENSTTPEFNVSEWFRRYVSDLCAIMLGPSHSLTQILRLLGQVDFKLATCAMILSKIQATLSAEFGASPWEARRPVKVFCRVLRHLERYDEVERIRPESDSFSVDALGRPACPSQSELLGLLYERAWLWARGRHDTRAATSEFWEILRLTGQDARMGYISHFRIKALRGLGVLAREEGQHGVSEQYFLAAWQESRKGFGRRDSNTVRIGSELEESWRRLGRVEEADQLRRERDELFGEEMEEGEG